MESLRDSQGTGALPARTVPTAPPSGTAQVQVSFTEQGPVVQHAGGEQQVHQVNSEAMPSPLTNLDAKTAEFIGRFQGEVHEIKKLIESGKTLTDVCAALGKQTLPPLLQEAKNKLMQTISNSFDRATNQKFKEALETARDDPDEAKALTKGFIEGAPWAKMSKTTILNSLNRMLDEKLSHVDPQLKAKIVDSIMGKVEYALEKSEKSWNNEIGEEFATHLGEHGEMGESLEDTMENCKKETKNFLDATRSKRTSESESINTLVEFTSKAAEKVLEELGKNPAANLSHDDVSALVSSVISHLESDIEGDYSDLIEAAFDQGVTKNADSQPDNVVKAIQKNLRREAQTEISCTKEDFQEALKECKNEKELAHVIGSILVDATDRTDNSRYEHTLTLLQEVYPDVKKYCLERNDGNRILSPQGVEVMLEVLKQKGKLNNIPAHLCLAPEQAISQLDQLAKGTTGDRVALIMRHDTDQDTQSGEHVHYFAVFAEKTDQGLRIAIPDSFSSHYYRDKLVEGIQKRFTAQGIPCKLLVPKITTVANSTEEITFRRQTDYHSCPIFALRDISQYCQHPEILDEIEHHAPKAEESSMVQIVSFERFPKALMKATQSLTKLAAYDDKSVMTELKQHSKINPIPAPTKLDPGRLKDANTLIMDRNRKYERLMIAAAIATGLVK